MAFVEGGCTCGRVRFELASPPIFTHCCHCRWCQRETGAAFALNALIEADRVNLLSGDVETVATPSLSGQGQNIVRCPDCRVAVWSHYAYMGIGDRVRFVRVGALDDPDCIAPGAHIFTESKQPWLPLDDSAPIFRRFYKASEVWSEESLGRRAKLFEGKQSQG